jgi:hypothetical protein
LLTKNEWKHAEKRSRQYSSHVYSLQLSRLGGKMKEKEEEGSRGSTGSRGRESNQSKSTDNESRKGEKSKEKGEIKERVEKRLHVVERMVQNVSWRNVRFPSRAAAAPMSTDAPKSEDGTGADPAELPSAR